MDMFHNKKKGRVSLMSNKFSINMEEGVRLEEAGRRNECRQEVLDWLCQGGNMRTVADIASGRGIVTMQQGDYGMFADLGNITVPPHYNHATWIGTFRARHGHRFNKIHPEVIDANFTHPSWILMAGQKFQVRIFHQFELGTTSASDRMAYLDSQNVVYTGFQGLALVFEKMRNKLPKSCNIVSSDKAENLCLQSKVPGQFFVPYMTLDDSRASDISLGSLGASWAQSYYMLGMTPLN